MADKKKWIDRDGLIRFWKDIKPLIDSKVNKIDGYTLSKNDFNDDYKAKVDGISDDPSTIISKLSNGTSDTLNDGVQIITQDTDTTQQKYYRRPLLTLWNYIKSKADSVYAAIGHNHRVNELENFSSHVYNATLSRTKRTVLAAPTGADGPASFRSLDKNDVGLGNVDNVQQLPKTGGGVGGRITRTVSGSWIADRDNVVVYQGAPGNSAYGAVAGIGTKLGTWTMGNLNPEENLIFNYVLDSNKSSGTNTSTVVRLPAQAGTIITSATIGNQTVAQAGNATTWAGKTLRQNHNTSDTWIPVFSNNYVDYILKSEIRPNGVADVNNSTTTTFAYSKSGMNYADYTWLAGWNGYELRAVNKSQFATAGHTHNYAGSSSAGGAANSANKLNSVGTKNAQTGRTQAYGDVYSYHSNSSAYSGMPTTYAATIGFGKGNSGTVEICGEWTGGKGLWSRALRDYQDNQYDWQRIYTSNYHPNADSAASCTGNSATATTAAKLGRGGATGTPMIFNWSGQSGQPSWLWGGNDGTNMYVWNPSNFSVNYAKSAGAVAWGNISGKPSTYTPSTPTATTTGAFSGVNASGSNYVRFTDGTQICWYAKTSDSNNKTTFDVPFVNTQYAVAFSGSDVWVVLSSKTTTGFSRSYNWSGDYNSQVAVGR